MTKQLEKAFEEVSKLSPREQDSVAEWLLAELDSEKQWDTRFANSQDMLSGLAKEALAEYQSGKTKDLHQNNK